METDSPELTVGYHRPQPVEESVISVWFWTDILLSFRISRPSGYQFNPGQFARLGLRTKQNTIEWRAFSIVSSKMDDELEFYAVLVPDGIFSRLLQKIKPGDPIWIENRSNGFMTTDCFTGGSALWMLATGTGIGPFISILQEPAIWQQYRNLVLVHCVRYANEFAYHNQLAAIAMNPVFAALPARFQLIKTVTREQALTISPQCLQGRITQLLKNGTLESAAGLALTPEMSRIMLCGNPDMITETRQLLHERSFKPCRQRTPGQFLSENYW